jgi:thioredoxin-related protein
LVAGTIDALRQEFNVSVARIDTDKAEELANKFEVHSIPTYILFKKTGSDITAV